MTELELAVGEVNVVIGPPGSGKTGLVRMKWKAAQKSAAYQPQRRYLFRGLIGANLGRGLTAEQCGLAGQYARRLGLEGVLADPTFVATDDEIARVTLARTLARPERLVILDEPMSSVAPEWHTPATAILRQALNGRTALIATTDPAFASDLAEHVAILSDGQIVQRGPIADVTASDAWPPG